MTKAGINKSCVSACEKKTSCLIIKQKRENERETKTAVLNLVSSIKNEGGQTYVNFLTVP